MDRGDVALACATALVDQLARGGVTDACISPGSRSTALALALERDERVQVHVHLDERSGAFFALGLAKALRAPVAVACTSGTAAAELFPAVVEASQSRTPLVLLTADRPPRLRGTGANQTIDQVELFGRYARAYVEPLTPSEPDDAAAWSRAARGALEAALGAPPGPVQVNCPFDEPLVPAGPAVPRHDTDPGPGARPAPRAAGGDGGVAAAISGRRGVVLAGPSDRPGETMAFLTALRGWPVVAEAASGVRRPGHALGAGQALLASGRWLDAHEPEVVIQIGAAPTTRATQGLVSSVASLVVIDDHHLEPDPEGRASLRVHTDPSVLRLDPMEPPPSSWLDDWRLADTVARRAVDDLLDRSPIPTELQVTRDVAAAVPDGGVLFVGNSMPVRDLDYAMAPRAGVRVLGNRGASGIDGLVSTALGVASGGTGPTLALLGDLSLLYDAGALLWNGRRGPDLTTVVLNNGGGQIFAALGQRSLPPPELSRLFVTPHDVDLGRLCEAAGVGHARVQETWAFAPALEHALTRGGIQVVEVMVDPDRSRAQRAQVQDAVDAALAALETTGDPR